TNFTKHLCYSFLWIRLTLETYKVLPIGSCHLKGIEGKNKKLTQGLLEAGCPGDRTATIYIINIFILAVYYSFKTIIGGIPA
ncbi:hypothetical protein ACJX0J_036978, partial [Zea mays]